MIQHFLRDSWLQGRLVIEQHFWMIPSALVLGVAIPLFNQSIDSALTVAGTLAICASFGAAFYLGFK